MPKFKKERVRATPYSKQKNNEMEVEVKNAPEIRDIDFKINDCIKEETKGAMLQRHKREYKDCKLKLEQMKTSQVKLSKRVEGQMRNRREIGRDMKQIEQELILRHKKELEQFDIEAKILDETFKFSTAFSYNDRSDKITSE